MEKTISSASYDVIVIKQPNGSYKSTPFQVAFSSNLLKNLEKSKKTNEIQFQVNNQLKDIPLKLDIKNGRIMFLKKYQKRNLLSDSSDVSDDDISQRSSSRDKIMGNVKPPVQKIQDYKNQEAPKPFWQFAWLFKSKKQQLSPKQKSKKEQVTEQQPQTAQKYEYLQKIQEQFYEGQQSSKQPMFHLSLCRTSLKKKQKKEEILKQFYQKRVPYNDFIKDPIKFIQNSELVVKIDDSIYTWQLGIAILTCRLAYGKQLSPALIDDMIRNKFTKSKWVTYFTGQNVTKIDISTQNLKKEYNSLTTGNTSQPTVRIVVKYRKTPDSQTIQKMNLKQGLNRAKFIMTTPTSNQQVNLKIFLWDYTEKIVISDIDGTITKSDILGQLLSKWIHTGVTKLFTQIEKRNYKIVYLTARAIGQYQQTIKFLQTVEQDGVKLPQGPLIMSPDGYMKSFTRQIIHKTPDYLKTKILATINQIFPNSRKPIFCGFGNRQTDSVAYLRINIDPEKIFCISDKSIITNESVKDFAITYVQMLEKIQDYFPVYVKEDDETLSNHDENLRKSKNSADLDDSFYNTKRRMSQSQNSQPGPNLDANNQYLLKSAQRFSHSRRNDQPKQEDQEQRKKEHYISKPTRTKSVQHMDASQFTQNLQDLQKLLKQSLLRNSTSKNSAEKGQTQTSHQDMTKSECFSPKKHQIVKNIQQKQEQGEEVTQHTQQQKTQDKPTSKKQKSQ